MNNKRKIVITITSILLVLVLIIGISYALEIFSSSSADNTIKSGNISMSYAESSNVINITNALPMTDNDGKLQSNYFDFSITSNATTNTDDNEGIKIPYNLIIEPKTVDADKDALTNDQIKVYLTKIESGVETIVLEPVKISELTAKDTNFNLYSTENIHKNNNGAITTKYRLRAWIDYEVESNDFNTKTYQYKFAVNVNATGEINGTSTSVPTVEAKAGAKTIIAKVGTGGLVQESHTVTEQIDATITYRYTGSNPDNYVSFNNELWRIIGIFDTDDGTGNIEKRIKIIRKDSLGDIAWDTKSPYGLNDWSKATLMTLMNTGDYWNRTSDYVTMGLTEGAKQMIGDAKWYLGGTAIQKTTNATQFYENERGTTVYDSTRPTSWVGKVGLMYLSDYGYATSGGSTTNRTACLEKAMFNWMDDSVSDCKNNDWLFNSLNQWTIVSYSGHPGDVFNVTSFGYVWGSDIALNTYAVRPSIYLSSDISISGGSGTETDPYTLSR